MGINKEKPSRGEAKHHRKVLSEERKKITYFQRQIDSFEKIEGRLGEINRILDTDNLNPRDRYLFFFEKKVVECKLDLINLSERMSVTDRELNKLKEMYPEAYEEVTAKDEKGRTILLRKILDQYLPPRK